MEKKVLKNNTKLKRIKIYKLFGKKDINLKFENIVKILVSENGAGKTTILNIISYILNGDFKNLKKIEFEKLDIEIENEIISITKNELTDFEKNIDEDSLINYLLEEILIKDKRLFRLLNDQLKTYEKINLEILYDEVRKIQRITGSIINWSFRIKQIMFERKENKLIKTFQEQLWAFGKEYNKNPALFDDKVPLLKNEVQSKLEKIKKIDIKTLYFTTYRRIEKELPQVYKIDGLNFGMGDISKKINEIIEEITRDTCEQFNKLNSQMLIKILTNDFSIKDGILSQDVETIYKNIQIVVQRLTNNENYLSENYKTILKNLEKIFKKNATDTNKFFLAYLDEMLQIYKNQESKEKKIRDFIEVCNKYLRNKKFNYLADRAIVEIKDNDNKTIDMAFLSSGEKQIVSIFAKIYLEDMDNLFIIIDEPELSIALDWQRMLLPDIINSEKCKLLLATTHSPFIFENEFDKYAEDLSNSFE